MLASTGHGGGNFMKGGRARSDETQDKLEITKAVHQHERGMHPGKQPTRLRLADGGMAGGGAGATRADKPSRGKKGGSGKTHVNILIAPQGDKGEAGGLGGPPPGPPPAPIVPPRPMPAPQPPMAPPPGASPMGVGAPMGGAPPMPSPGGPPRPMPPAPMMRKAGGRAGRTRLQDGGGAMMVPGMNPMGNPAMGPVPGPAMGPPINPAMPGLKGGGRAYSPPNMKAGADSGVGRLNKIGKECP